VKEGSGERDDSGEREGSGEGVGDSKRSENVERPDGVDSVIKLLKLKKEPKSTNLPTKRKNVSIKAMAKSNPSVFLSIMF